MRLSEELAAAILIERRQNEFDKEWVAGVKAGWKQLYQARKTFKGRVVKSRYKAVSAKRDDKAVKAAAKASKVYLLSVKTFLENLQQDLLINKGFWQPTRGKPMGMLAKPKSTIVRALHNAIEAIESPRYEYEYGHKDLLSAPWNTNPAFVFSDLDGMNAVLRGVALRADDQVKKIDGLLTRGVWKTLNQILDGYAGEVGAGKDADNSWSISKGYESTELNLGRVRVKFEGTPVDPMGLDRTKQKKYGRNTWDYPKERKKVVDQLKKTQALLKNRGLESEIWYGDIHVLAHGSGYVFKDAKKRSRRAAADWSHHDDSVRIFGAHNVYPGMLIHELGHRYYYRVMTQKDRDAFDKWYGEVKATSGYGASSTVEDFAEVFMEYVLGKMKLDRDQIERFEAVLKGKIQVDVPETVSGSAPDTFKWAGTMVAFVDMDTPKGKSGMVRDTPWSRPLSAIQLINNHGGLKRVRQMWRHGVVIRPPRPGYPPVDYDAKAGVLTMHMATPISSTTALKSIGLAFFLSDLVKPKMRAAWKDLWSKRLQITDVGKRFGYEFARIVDGRHVDSDMDKKNTELLYWLLGHQGEPDFLSQHDEPHEIPTPRQMHQRSRMKMVGMESRMGSLSSALMEAICW
jgi:hypothetical protein